MAILLAQTPKSWDYGCSLPCWAWTLTILLTNLIIINNNSNNDLMHFPRENETSSVQCLAPGNSSVPWTWLFTPVQASFFLPQLKEGFLVAFSHHLTVLSYQPQSLPSFLLGPLLLVDVSCLLWFPFSFSHLFPLWCVILSLTRHKHLTNFSVN